MNFNVVQKISLNFFFGMVQISFSVAVIRRKVDPSIEIVVSVSDFLLKLSREKSVEWSTELELFEESSSSSLFSVKLGSVNSI
jgi:hypothetical protein